MPSTATALPPPSSSSAAATTKSKKRSKLSRQELLKCLEILGPLSAPLPPRLPPSPPASRHNSPSTAGHKRKAQDDNVDGAAGQSKRARKSVAAEQQPPRHEHIDARSHRSDPAAEEGELRAQPPSESAVASSSSSSSSAFVPVRRPRRSLPDSKYWSLLHEKARELKYSGDARFFSTYPPQHHNYKPLADPPPPNSPYAKHSGMIARLEMLDAVVTFAYSYWIREYPLRICIRNSWQTMFDYTKSIKHRWNLNEAVGEKEKAFIGFITMLEGFIMARYAVYAARQYVGPEMQGHATRATKDTDKAYEELKAREIAKATLAAAAKEPASAMLPSPVSLASTSANSTPVSTRNDGTPDGSAASASPSSGTPQPSARRPPTLEEIEKNLPSKHAVGQNVQINLSANLVNSIADQNAYLNKASSCLQEAQKYLNLPVIAKHFPITFARLLQTSLTPGDEHQPDIEDDEGELFWPPQCASGEGIGWLALMGRSMVREFGKEYGYKGYTGMIPKPPGDPRSDDTPTPPALPPSSRPGSTTGSSRSS